MQTESNVQSLQSVVLYYLLAQALSSLHVSDSIDSLSIDERNTRSYATVTPNTRIDGPACILEAQEGVRVK